MIIKFLSACFRILFLVMGCILWLIAAAFGFMFRLIKALAALVNGYVFIVAWPWRVAFSEFDLVLPEIYNPFTDKWTDTYGDFRCAQTSTADLVISLCVGWWFLTALFLPMLVIAALVHSYNTFKKWHDERGRKDPEPSLIPPSTSVPPPPRPLIEKDVRGIQAPPEIVPPGTVTELYRAVGETCNLLGIDMTCVLRQSIGCEDCVIGKHPGNCHKVACCDNERPDGLRVKFIPTEGGAA